MNVYGAAPDPRIDGLTFDLTTTTSTAKDVSILGLDVGARVDVSPLPTAAPTSSLSLVVEGLAERITTDEWELQLTTSPFSVAQVWLLGDATNGVLGTTTRLDY